MRTKIDRQDNLGYSLSRIVDRFETGLRNGG
jgi:hypothetical protein